MCIAFIDSWVQSSAEGSGTAVAIGGLRRALRRRGIKVTRLAPPSLRPANLMARRLMFNLYLPSLLRQIRYDLVVGFDIDGFMWSGRTGGVPFVSSIKGVLAEESRQEEGAPQRMLWRLSRLERQNVRSAAAVLATSEYCREAIVRSYDVAAERVSVVPEGIDIERWRQIARDEPRDSDGATILCVARQYPRKHVVDLLRALPAVRRAIPHAHVWVVGDGPEHGKLRAVADELQLGDGVRFFGAIPDDAQVARMYRHADVFCLPSVQEGFGIVYLEAMASGLPIVATTAAAIPEVVPQDRAGTLIAPGDVAALADALIVQLGDRALRERYGAFGRDYVARYDWDTVAGMFLDTVQPLVKG